MKTSILVKTLIFSILSLSVLWGCSKDPQPVEEPEVTYTLSADKTEAEINEIITFTVTSSVGEDVTSGWSICDESLCFTGNKVSYMEAGTHTIAAHMKADDNISAVNTLTVTITGGQNNNDNENNNNNPDTPSKINPNATYVLYADKGSDLYLYDGVRFYVKEVVDGEVVTEQFSGFKVGLVGAEKESRYLVGERIYLTETGTFDFDAVLYYGANMASEFKTEKITVNVSEREITGYTEDFYHRSLFMKWTATWCPSCPKLETDLIDFMAARFHDRIVPLALHSYDGDECNVGSQIARLYEESELDYNIFSIPSCVIDFNDNWRGTSDSKSQLANHLEKSLSRAASSVPGLAAETKLNGRSLSCTIKTTVREEGNYYLGVFFIEDGVETKQSGAAGSRMMQNHVVHFYLTEGVGTFDLHDCGHLTGGQEYVFSTTFEIPVHEEPADFVFENCHIVYLICRQDSSITPYGFYCANAASVKIGESADYEYEPVYAE